MAAAFEHRYATMRMQATDGGTDYVGTEMKIWKLALPRCGAAIYVHFRDIHYSMRQCDKTRAQHGNATRF
eukprot:3642581-Lingulodinium_polyedra.AAC.1